MDSRLSFTFPGTWSLHRKWILDWFGAAAVLEALGSFMGDFVLDRVVWGLDQT